MLITRLTAAALPLLALAVACESNDKQAGTTSGTTYTVPHYDAGPIPPTVDFSKIPDPWPANTIAACKAYVSTTSDGGLVSPKSIRDCYCTNCLALMHQCDALEGCREIVGCGYYTGCAAKGAANMPLNCYFTGTNPLTGCTAIIDKWGNTGAATYLADKLGVCGAAANCPVQ